jgi:sugar phosphate isomerase/epimerase
MRKCKDWPVSACSWSLRSDIDRVIEVLRGLDIGYVHLAARPALEANGKAYLGAVRKSRLKISALMIDFPSEDYTTLESIRATGGIIPDGPWETNRKLALGAIDLAGKLGVKLLSLHAGFLEHTAKGYDRKLLNRVNLLADAAKKKGVKLLMETGQEAAAELRHFMETVKHPALAINFDPANMILYDKGNPIEAVRILGKWIRHVHAKDAVKTATPGTWGTEVPWGEGQVNTGEFLRALKEVGYKGALAIEREAGDDRAGDIRKAAERLSAFPG